MARVFRPDAFSIMDLERGRGQRIWEPDGKLATFLSIMDMRGATIDAAHAALVKSAPSLKPMFFVFHRCCSPDEGMSLPGSGIGDGDAGLTSGFSTPTSFFIVTLGVYFTLYTRLYTRPLIYLRTPSQLEIKSRR